ncbi:MAG: hypothetical protein ACM3ZA_07265 [Bacillota bacterium]
MLVVLAAVPGLASADGSTSFVGRAGWAARTPGSGPAGSGVRIGPLSDQVASLLGMSLTDLQAARQSGKSLAEIAAEKGISRDTLVADLLKLHQDAVAARVADGKLTQAQADQITAAMESRIEAMVDAVGTGPAGRGCGGAGRGRMGGGMGGRSGMGSGPSPNLNTGITNS